MVDGRSSPRITPVALAPWGFLNAYLIRDERTIVVDAGYPRMAGGVLRALRDSGIRPADVSLILLTHGHLDHLGRREPAARSPRCAGGPPCGRCRDRALRAGSPAPRHGPLRSRLRALRTQDGPGLRARDRPRRRRSTWRPTAWPAAPSPRRATPQARSASSSASDAICGDLLAGRALRGGSPRLPYFADDLAAIEQSVRELLAEAPGRWHIGHRGPLRAEQVETWIRGRAKRG